MFIFREGEQVIQREALIHVGNEFGSNGGWLSERRIKRKEKLARNHPGRRIEIDRSGGLLQSVEWIED